MRNGAAHDVHGLPWIVAGKGGGTIRTGRVLRERGLAHNQVLTAIANAMLAGSGRPPIASFGDPDYTGEYPGLRIG